MCSFLKYSIMRARQKRSVISQGAQLLKSFSSHAASLPAKLHHRKTLAFNPQCNNILHLRAISYIHDRRVIKRRAVKESWSHNARDLLILILGMIRDHVLAISYRCCHCPRRLLPMGKSVEPRTPYLHLCLIHRDTTTCVLAHIRR